MACNETWLEILSAWYDGEATSEEIARASVHLTGCARCEATLVDFRRVRAAFRGRATPLARPAPRRRWAVRLGAAVALAAAAVLVWVRSWQDPTGLAQELEARHLMAFSRTPACEFHSSDPATVGHWLAENVGYEVKVPTMPDAELLGARQCALRGGTIASVLYRRGSEGVTLFLPREGTTIAGETDRLARKDGGCVVGRLGLAVCAEPGRVATAETRQAALAALQSR